MNTFLGCATLGQVVLIGCMLGAVIGGNWASLAAYAVAALMLEVVHAIAGDN